jgi:hypothetical protein
MEHGAKVAGTFGAVYEWQGDANGHFKITKKDGSINNIPAKDVLTLAAHMLRPRLVAKANAFVDELFKGL